MRAARAVPARNRHKKILKLAKGMQKSHRRSFRLARQAVTKAMQYAYRDRRNKRRDLRSLWILRISAAAEGNDLNYSALIHGLKASNIELDRKILSEIAVNQPAVFKAIAEIAKKK